MKRRAFLAHTGTALIAAGASPSLFANVPKNTIYSRLGMTTVVFRNQFEQTRPKNFDLPLKPLTLLEIPEYFSDRFKLRNIEFWSQHFESTSDSYIGELKKTIDAHHTRLINIQLDGRYDISATDEEERLRSIEFVKGWIDTAHKLGAKGLRSNPGGQELEKSVESLKLLAPYAESKGVTLYVENHLGFGKFPQNMLKIHHRVSHPNLQLLTDFANFDPSVDPLESIAMLMPETGLISAKAKYVDTEGNHPDYDFVQCVQTAEKSGFRGIYSAEYYDSKNRPVDPEFIADWMLKHLAENIAG